MKKIYQILLRGFGALPLLLLGLAMPASPQGATGAFSEAEAALNAAEKNFETGKQAFEDPAAKTDSGAKPGQKSGKLSYSDASLPKKAEGQPLTEEEARARALQGSPETGYAGTWTDPENGDIITSVIAPRPPAQTNGNSYPLYIAPSIGSWNSDSDYSGWSGGYPSWPVTPDNPGYGTPVPPPPPGPGYPPPAGPGFGNNFYPYPHPPQDFNPGYRPLRPGPPPGAPRPGGNNPGWNSGNPFQPQPPWMSQNPALRPTPSTPPLNQNPGQPPSWLPGQPSQPYPGGNPGFNPPAYPGGNPGAYPPPTYPTPGGNYPPPYPGNPPSGGSLWNPGLDRTQGGFPGHAMPRNGFNSQGGMGRSLMDTRRQP